MKQSCRALALAAFLGANSALAETIQNILPAALDQPRINAALTLTPGLNAGNVLTADFGGGITSFNIEAYFDTGASGVLLSEDTADLLGITRATVGGQNVVFSDVGANGSDNFHVSQPLYVHLAPYTPDAVVDDTTNFSSYSQSFGPIRTEIGPLGGAQDPFLGDIDVFGVPVMQNKVVVMDPKPVNTLLDTIRTRVYDAGSASIPTTSRHVRLSKADFSPYTQVTPAGAPGPTQNGNPFIGSNPITGAQAGDPPPVSISLGSLTTNGNFLLDTGAAASMISTTMAANLHVRYTPGTFGTLNPQLEIFDPAHPSDPPLNVPGQFTLDIGGIGGTTRIAGFFLDSLTLPTQEGQSNSSNNLLFSDAPVLVNDITLLNPTTNQPLTLDGIFGMNYLVASALIEEVEPFPQIVALESGHFGTIVYDDPGSMLGLTVNTVTAPFANKIWLGPLSGDPVGAWNFDDKNWFDWASGNFNGKFVNGDDTEFEDGFTNDVDITMTVMPASVNVVNDSTFTFYTSTSGRISGTTAFYKSGTGSLIISTQNTYTGATDIQEGTVVFTVPQNIGPVIVRADATLRMQASQQFQGLGLIDGKAKLSTGGQKFIRVDTLDISGTGQLDLGDGDLIISDKNLTTPEMARAYLFGGRNGGSWNGAGIVSSFVAASPKLYAIGYADNAELGRASFHGEGLDAQSIVFQLTFAGDANLDGMVDIRDLYMLALNFNHTNTFWYSGDFNYDGITDARDLGIFSYNWQRGTGVPLLGDVLPGFGLPQDSIPEPASLGLASLMAIAAVGRPRLRRNLSRI